ncbi:MAG: alpha-L-fucosidase [Opitutaceae bacterium]|nr:alpha-L-fucosidase [Opitutaceae bacterium]
MKTLCQLLSALILPGCFSAAGAAPAPSAPSPTVSPAERAESEARIAWWRANRFGLFVHWGPVSLKGTEIGWSRAGERRGYRGPGTLVPTEVYDNLYQEFNPVRFDAREWVALAQAAGMKYIVFTSRHHDGFSMFDTAASDYKITSPLSPFRRDVVRELADAAHAAGLKFGLYYSQPNWHHPDAFTADRHGRYLAYLKTQVRELLTNYGRVDILWFDGLGKKAEDYDGVALNRMARDLQPHLLINNRDGLPEDFDTPEQRVGKYQDDRPWESCITICKQWAWKPEDTMKSLAECVQTLVRCAGGDGNLLFNVGPMPDGRIEPRQVERLREMGAWLARNGESIYATRGGPWHPTKTIASTRKGNTVYVHAFDWKNAKLELPALPRAVKSAALLGGGRASVRQENDKLIVEVDPASRDEIDTVVKLELSGSAMDIPAIPLTPTIKATASNVFRANMADHGPQEAFDGNPSTRWATDAGTKHAWIARDLEKPTAIGQVRINEAIAERVRKFQLQYREGDAWTTIFAGERIGRSFTKTFPPVTAREFRLNILEATEGPTIAEIELSEK